jgi:alpha-L-fucosidase
MWLPLLFVFALTLVAFFPQTRAHSDSQHSLKWFQDARFGLFIHWGPYSQRSIEASWPIMQKNGAISYEEYSALPRTFMPISFDARAWVRLAKAAGQKYIVFTTKHHDGFVMWDADNMSDYKITATPFGRDIFAELAEAAHEEGVPLGIYYSPPDLHHPGYRDTSRPPYENALGDSDRPQWNEYLDYMEDHLRQLLTRYGPIAIVWFDGLMDIKQQRYDGERFHALVRRLQPDAIINDRIGPPGDFSTPEQHIPPAGFSVAWETCMTINDTWAYNKFDRNFKSSEDLIHALVDIASKNGNFLLNVGPSPMGEIQIEFRERLLAMGAWLQTNGEAIYGTRGGPVQGDDFRTTAKGRRIYVHLMRVPQSGRFILPWSEAPKITRVSMLASGKNVRMHRNSSDVEIELPPDISTQTVPVIAIDM